MTTKKTKTVYYFVFEAIMGMRIDHVLGTENRLEMLVLV